MATCFRSPVSRTFRPEDRFRELSRYSGPQQRGSDEFACMEIGDGDSGVPFTYRLRRGKLRQTFWSSASLTEGRYSGRGARGTLSVFWRWMGRSGAPL